MRISDVSRFLSPSLTTYYIFPAHSQVQLSFKPCIVIHLLGSSIYQTISEHSSRESLYRHNVQSDIKVISKPSIVKHIMKLSHLFLFKSLIFTNIHVLAQFLTIINNPHTHNLFPRTISSTITSQPQTQNMTMELRIP